jgi:DNA-binding transcriptional LysR family regulator
MELRHLTYFLAVAETKNFTRAAANCFVAQSALSQQISRLETEVGTALFFRSSRSVRLTPAGELLVPLARRILVDVDNAQAELDALTGLRRGRLRLGLIQTVASAVDLIDIMGEYHRQFPDVDFEVSNDPSAAMVTAVAEGHLDLAVVGLDLHSLPLSLEHRLLALDPLVAVVPERHALAGRVSIGLEELSRSGQFIHFRRGSGLRQHVEAAFLRAGAKEHGSFEMGQVQDMVRLAARNVGITVVPRSSVTGSDALAVSTIPFRVLRLTDKEAVHPVSVVYDGKRLSSAAKAFLETLDRRSKNP